MAYLSVEDQQLVKALQSNAIDTMTIGDVFATLTYYRVQRAVQRAEYRAELKRQRILSEVDAMLKG